MNVVASLSRTTFLKEEGWSPSRNALVKAFLSCATLRSSEHRWILGQKNADILDISIDQFPMKFVRWRHIMGNKKISPIEYFGQLK